ncbi:UNVERIFIED_ORG: hypothetical protein B2H98_05360 [Clostridium botulinum]
MVKYEVAEYGKTRFTCPYCGALAGQRWDFNAIIRDSNEGYKFFNKSIGAKEDEDQYFKTISVSTCDACYGEHIWFKKEMISPKISNVPMPLDEMPESVKKIYNEARDVFSTSYKAATALLRLALQYLCIELGGDGENINNDIGNLVKEKRLPIQIQKALDIVRVAGNNAVHPGVLDLEDEKTSAVTLFEMINFIVDNQIIQPKKIDEFYNSLPSNALNGIRNRDK